MKKNSKLAITILGTVALSAAGLYWWLRSRKVQVGEARSPAIVDKALNLAETLLGQDPSPQRAYKVATSDGEVGTINSPLEGVDYINRNFGRLTSQGRTVEKLPSGYSVRVNGVSGVFRSGTVSEIRDVATGGTKSVFLGVRGVERDSSGLSATDRRIIKNIKAARARGENPIVANRLQRFV